MKNNLIDISLFADGIELWPNQVFYKNFDAYFLLSYPSFDYNPNDENIFDPFSFLNNLSEKYIYISDPSGTKNLTFALDEHWNRQLYFDAFKNLKEDRFLFWEGVNETWAMVSDAKYKVAVIGIDWKVADQVPLFFNQCLLSPKQFLDKVGMAKYEKIFLHNYQPAKVLTDGNAENPIWHKYFFECKVENENDKIFYWKQLEQVYEILSNTLQHCKRIDLYADQMFERAYFQNKQWYRSMSNAPVGGWQNFNLKNCEKIATKFLSSNKHLQLIFEGNQDVANELFRENKKGLIVFSALWVYANLQKVSIKESRPEFYFETGMYSFGSKSDAINQQFNVGFIDSFLNENAASQLVNQLSKVGKAIEVKHLQKPKTFADYKKDKPLIIQSVNNATIKESTE